MRLAAAFAAALCAITGQAVAQEVPVYDVDQHCRSVASFGGSFSEMMFNACFDQEQSGYDGIKPRWAGLPVAMRRHCDQVARFGGAGSYMMLQACVQQEEAAAGQNRQRQFRR